MGNRSFLYVTSPSSRDSAQQIAEANNHLPALWQILLADGYNDAAIDDQRVFGDAGTDNIASDAAGALLRLRTLVDYLARQDAVLRIEGLIEYLEGAVEYLSDCVDACADDDSPPLFSANVDELSWLTSEDPKDFIRTTINDMRLCWQRAVAAMNSNDLSLLAQALGFEEPHISFGELLAWGNSFGLAGLQHPYFYGAHSEVPSTSFRNYDPDAEPMYVGAGCYRFKRDGLFGIRRSPEGEDDDASSIVAPATWTRLWQASADHDGLLWVEHEDKIGLARIADEHGFEILLSPQLDSVNDFDGKYAVVEQAALFGYLDVAGEWMCSPRWKNAFSVVNDRAVVVDENERFGYIDTSGQPCTEFIYADASDFSGSGIASVCVGGRWGLIDRSGSWVVQPSFNSIVLAEDLNGWICESGDGDVGLLAADGSAWIEPAWQAIAQLVPGRLLKVQREERWGVIDHLGVTRVECAYDDVLPRSMEDPARAPLQLIGVLGERQHLLDEHGELLVPDRFVAVQELEPHPYADHAQLTRLDLMRVSEDAENLGVWDIAHQRLLIACEWTLIMLVQFGAKQQGFLVGRDRQGSMKFGLLREDGSAVAAPEYGWIGHPDSGQFTFDVEALSMRNKIYECWARGKPVPAHSSEGLEVLIHPDGRIESKLNHLRDEYARGNLEAALELARHFDASDPQQATDWYGRAAGVEGLPLNKQQGLLEGKYQYGWRLRHGEGCEPDLVQARRWLESAYKYGGAKDTRVLCELGGLLWDERAGELDEKRGFQLFAKAAQLGDEICMFNEGLGHYDGRGTTMDLERAIECFQRSAAAGYSRAPLMLARALREHAENEGSDLDERRARFEAATSAFRQAAEQSEREGIEEACLALGALAISGEPGTDGPSTATDWYVRAAEAGSARAMEILVTDFYGAAGRSPDLKQARYWQKKLKDSARK